MTNLNHTTGTRVADAIDKRIINVAQQVYDNSPNDKMRYGTVVSKDAGVFSVKINNTIYPNVKALRNVGNINIGEVVHCLVPNNNFSNMVILGVADGTIGGSGGSMPVGSIISSAIPLTDAGVHLLDGGLISTVGVYADFATLLNTLVQAGYNLTCTQAQFDADVTRTGNCGKFVIDTTNNTIRLPKITRFIQGLTNLTDIGTSLSAGLPNITGNLSTRSNTSNTGAFTTKTLATSIDGGSTTLGTAFDASRSNPIYGNSDTVQPEATQYPYYIVLSNATKTEIEVDIDQVTSDLNQKADKDLSNTTFPVQHFYDWVTTDIVLKSSGSANWTTIDLSSYLPSTGGNELYEVLLSTRLYNTSGGISTESSNLLYTDIVGSSSSYLYMCGNSSQVTNRQYFGYGIGTLPVHRYIYYKATSLDSCVLKMFAYRRVK